jgi:cellulose synthase/poly-beta-1,6-N-acetylglucosamine synthase-like glycosyltransferase
MVESPSVVDTSDAVVPEVSVIVPAYNSARTISRCLEALAMQRTVRPFEIIVVHSGNDDTCARATETVSRCRTFQMSGPMVAAAARHYGVGVARGAILAFIDSDVYVTEDWIEQVWSAAQTGADLICGSIENLTPGSAVSRAEQLLMFNEFLPDAPQQPSWFALSGNTIFPRATYARFGPFDAVRAAEDVVFSRRLVAKGGTILFYPRLRAFHQNRTQLAPFLRNQFVLGRHTAIARRSVTFADASYFVFLLMLPMAPAAKLAKITLRMMRWNRRNVLRIAREMPLLSIGLIAYSLGMVTAVFARRPAPPDGGGIASALPDAPAAVAPPPPVALRDHAEIRRGGRGRRTRFEGAPVGPAAAPRQVHAGAGSPRTGR